MDFEPTDYSKSSDQVRAANPANTDRVEAESPSHRRFRNDHLLERIYWAILANAREDILGDIIEDVIEQRERGGPEWRVRRHIWWQAFRAVWQHFNLWDKLERVRFRTKKS